MPEESRENIFENEDRVRQKLRQQIFKPIKGGYQIKTVFLNDELALYVPKYRHHIFWDEKTVRWIQTKPILGPCYLWARTKNAFPMFYLKQMIKYVIAFLRRDPAAGPLAIMTTLEGYTRAKRLTGLVDPFLILYHAKVKTGRFRQISLPIAIVRERCDKTLLMEIIDLALAGKIHEAKKRIDEAMILDQQIWEHRLANIDFSLKNCRLRHGRVVLRDAGNLKEDYREIVDFLESLGGAHGELKEECHPMKKNTSRLSDVSPELARYYWQKSLQTYPITNFQKYWFRTSKRLNILPPSVSPVLKSAF